MSTQDGGDRQNLQASIGRTLPAAFILLDAVERHALLAVNPPLTTAQYHALVALGRSPGQNLNELAGRLLCDKANASKLMDRLTSMGLATRARNEDDARQVILRLTPEGETALEAGTHARMLALSEVFSPVGPADLAEIEQRLRTVVDLLERTTGMHADRARTRSEPES